MLNATNVINIRENSYSIDQIAQKLNGELDIGDNHFYEISTSRIFEKTKLGYELRADYKNPIKKPQKIYDLSHYDI